LKLLKSWWKVCLVAVASFVLGAWLFRTPVTKAAPNGNVYIKVAHVSEGAYLKEIQVNGSVAVNGIPVQGSSVVGFSCFADPAGNATCYIASM